MMRIFSAQDIVVEGSRLKDCHDLSDIHHDCFPRGWSAAEFTRLMENGNVRALQARRPATWLRPKSHEPKGFVLVRMAADEAEILTIAVSRSARGLGLGRRLMEAIMRDLYADRIINLFLEVDETNRAALALYRSLGFAEVGERQSYYTVESERNKADNRHRALVMRCDLR